MSLDLIALFEKGPQIDEIKSDENENDKNEDENQNETSAAVVVSNGDISATEEEKFVPLKESLVYARQESLVYNDVSDTYVPMPVVIKTTTATTSGPANRFSKVRIECVKDKYSSRKNSKFKVDLH